MRWLLAGLWFIASHSVAATTLTARVDRHTLVLGESLVLEITARAAGATAPLERLSLDALHADFAVLDVSRNTQTLTATLYPLRSGRLKIPVLNIFNARSLALDIVVHASSAVIPRVVLRSGVEPSVPHVRETVLLYLDVYDNGGLIWSAVEAPAAPGVYLRELAGSRRTARIDGEMFKVVRHAWAATPLHDGEHTLQFSLLRANRFGVRLRYAASKLKFTAQAVPAYVPVLVPVGAAPQLQVAALPEEIVVNRPMNFKFSVTGTGLSENGLAQIFSATLGSAPGMRFYPLKIAAGDAARSTTLMQTFHVTLPFQALHSGELDLPEMLIPYFDPQLERLGTVVLAKQRITAVSPLRQTAWWIGGAGITLLALVWPVRRVVVALRQYQRRRSGLQRIERAPDIHGLKTALLKFDASGSGTYKPFATLRLWLTHTRATQRIDAECNALILRLERACYTANTGADDFADLKSDLLRNLKAG